MAWATPVTAAGGGKREQGLAQQSEKSRKSESPKIFPVTARGVAKQLQVPSPAPEKSLCLLDKGFFQLNPPFRVGEIVFDDEISCGDEIRLDGGWVDLISSAEQISSEQCEDFIVRSTISFETAHEE